MNSLSQTCEKPDQKGRPDTHRYHGFLAVVAMLMGVAALYRPWLVTDSSQTLFGFDYLQLHARRLDYARDALLNAHPHLPAWYSRELMGAPFWSNIQNFPFLPTRFPLLLIDPLQAYALGVNLAAALAALFTYMYCRRIGLTRLASASSGWTFAASGFFASRVMAGHLPLLEAYPTLPLLLWLIELVIQQPAQKWRFDFHVLVLSVACTCIVMAGRSAIAGVCAGYCGSLPPVSCAQRAIPEGTVGDHPGYRIGRCCTLAHVPARPPQHPLPSA